MSGYAQALANFGALTDEKTGIIRSVEVMKIAEWDPAVFLASAEPCDTTPLAGIRAANRGAACSAERDRAIVRACGESVERYCSAFFNVAALRCASERELTAAGSRFVSVNDLYPFADAQYAQPGFPYRKALPDSRLRWVPGESLTTGEEVWVPASCVYVPYLFNVAVEPFTHMPISTGLAAGPGVEECVRKGILEILERDALMVVWYARLSMPSIDPRSCWGHSPQVDRLLAATSAGASSWRINLLTLDVDVPVVSAALVDPGDPPLTSFGIAADPDPARALLLALEEAALTRVLLNRTAEVVAGDGYVHGPLRTLRDHLLAHATSATLRARLDFLLSDGPEIEFGALVDRERERQGVGLAQRLRTAGMEALWIEVTTSDVREFGFRVVRTVIPGTQPLDNDHHHRHLGGLRPLTAPPRLGFPAVAPEAFNPDPHPFP